MNKIQFEFNQQILQIVENLLSALNNDDTNKAKGLCGDLTAKLKRRNKSIKMADRSVVGWALLRSMKLIQSLRSNQTSREQGTYQKEN